MNRRGQLSIINLIFFVVLVIITAVLTPVIQPFIDNLATGTLGNNTTAMTIANLVIPFIWVGLIITFFTYIIPNYIVGPR